MRKLTFIIIVKSKVKVTLAVIENNFTSYSEKKLSAVGVFIQHVIYQISCQILVFIEKE